MSLTTEYLRMRGVAFETIPHDQAFTTIEEARALGVRADQLVKTLLLDTERGHALAVIPGDRRLEMHLVALAVGDPHVRMASEPEMQRDLPGIELGAVPPLGGLLKFPVYVDPRVAEHETVVFAAGSQTESIKIGSRDLLDEEGVTVAPITAEPSDVPT
ncbi:MAG: YbaK/EbsC family protein [Actinomycetota bacterium]